MPRQAVPQYVARSAQKHRMAKLYFYYSSMNAGKSTALLQSSYNYRERGMNTVVMAPTVDNRYGVGKVTSRIGLESEAITFTTDDNLFELVDKPELGKSLCIAS